MEVIKVWFSSFRQLIKMINELFCESRKTWLIRNINEDNRIYYERHELELYAALKKNKHKIFALQENIRFKKSFSFMNF